MKKLLLSFMTATTLVSGQFVTPPPSQLYNHDAQVSFDQLLVVWGVIFDESRDADFIKYFIQARPPVPFPQANASRAENAKASIVPVVAGTLHTTYGPTSYMIVAPFYDYSSAPLSNPQLIFIDGRGDGLISIDMAALKVASVVPGVVASAGPLAIRPNTAEVWTPEGGRQIDVANLTTQTVAARIPTSSIPITATPAGIAFTPDGATAFEAVHLASPDASGNNGALITINATTRTVTSTLLLKTTPTALLMAPDGSTAYILNDNGALTYYDILTATADRTVQTVQPGNGFGYPGFSSAVGIHPDGSRIFWNVGVYLVTYDLTTHSITGQFNSGLPTTVGRTFSLSPDGEQAYFSDPLGDVAIVSTRYGTVLASFNTGSPSAVWAGPLVAP